MKRLSLRTRKEHFDAIVRGEKDLELRPYTDYWHRRFDKLNPEREEVMAVFVCGRSSHRRRVKRIEIGYPEKFLGRPLSEQGRKDIPTKICYAIRLGWRLCPECGEKLYEQRTHSDAHPTIPFRCPNDHYVWVPRASAEVA